ncbi:MAG: hypothetical protein RLZZ398_804 [Verrucomicrobiota bacterium]|jgi:hypothetical protein
MNPINPWLDPAEVRRMADRLIKPAREPNVTVADAGFDERFVGYAAPQAAPPPVHEVPAAVVAVPVAIPVGGPITSKKPLIARNPLFDHITRFRDWMRHNFAATGIFVLDGEGAVIFDENNHGRLHFLARSLVLASRRPRISVGNVHIKISAGATLEVIPVETAYGRLVLGAVVAESLAPASVAAVMKALAQVQTS